MHQKKKKNRTQHLLLYACALQVLFALLCFGAWQWLAHLLPSQRAAERWQGDGELPFSQVSVFFPADELVELKDLSDFRNKAMKAMEGAALDVKGSQQLLLDAWSTTATLYTSGQHGRGEVTAIAVGGNFFDIHPLTLLSGNYIRQSDLMDDRILLSEDVAWLLFGGTDLHGMTIKLNGVPFVVAGVVAAENDFASKRANSDGMDLYMSYDGLRRLEEEAENKAQISCYECVLADPVKNFAVNVIRENLATGRNAMVCNTTRYDYWNMMTMALAFGQRGTATTGAVLPYWESAARITENWGMLACMLMTLLLIMPLVCACLWCVGTFRRVREKMEDDTVPEIRERVEEAIRVQQRRHWERKHGKHEQ